MQKSQKSKKIVKSSVSFWAFGFWDLRKKSFSENVGEFGIYSQFHQHFMSRF